MFKIVTMMKDHILVHFVKIHSNKKAKLDTHMKRHTGNVRRPHPCKECGKAFYTRTILKTHMVIHSDERAFICRFTDCDKTSKLAQTLN